MKSEPRGLLTGDIIIDQVRVLTEEEYQLIENQCEINFKFLENIIFKDFKNAEDTL